MPKKYDWSDWLDGMRSKAMKAGAEAITTQLGAWFTTNAVATLPIEALHGVGLNYKTAIVALVVQFTVRVVYAAALYVQQQPDPVVEVNQEFNCPPVKNPLAVEPPPSQPPKP